MIKLHSYIALILAVIIALLVAACAKDAEKSADKGERLEDVLTRRAASMGENILRISESDEGTPGSRPAGTVILPPKDAEDILKQCSAVRYVSPTVGVPGNFEYMGRTYSELFGAAPDYFPIFERGIAKGSAFSEADLRECRRVCVLGAETATRFFGKGDAVGKSVSLVWNNQKERRPCSFRVIGVLQEKGPGLDGSRRRDAIAVIPWTTAKKEAGDGSGGVFGWCIQVKAVSRDRVPEAIRQITAVLRKRHNLKNDQADDFEIKDQNKWIDETVKWETMRQKAQTIVLEPDAGIRDILGKGSSGVKGPGNRKGSGHGQNNKEQQ